MSLRDTVLRDERGRGIAALAALALAFAVAIPTTSAQPGSVAVVASGLTSPFGIAAGPDGNLYVVEQGTGADDAQVSIVTPSGEVFPFLVGLQSASAEGEVSGTWNLAFDGTDLWITQGLQDSFESYLLRVSTAGFTPGGPPLTEADLDAKEHVGAFVETQGYPESNLYNLTVGPDGDLFLVDAAANAILRRDAATGALSVFASFPSIPNPTPVGPPEIQAVPTSIVFTSDGFLVTALTGFPFVPGLSRVYRVALDGTVTLFQDGLTSLTDIALDPGDGHPVVLTFAKFRLAPPPDGGFQPGTGALTGLFDGAPGTLAPGLDLTPAFTFGADGALYVTSLFGLVLRIEPANVPPVPVGIADGQVFMVEVGGGAVNIDFSFLSPEAGQTTTISSPEFDSFGDPAGGLASFDGTITFTTTPGNPAVGQISAIVSAGAGVVGGDSYSVTLDACDDGPGGGACTQITIQIDVPPVPTRSCEPGDWYVFDFDADGDGEGFLDATFSDGEYVRVYAAGPGNLDLSGCTLTAWDPVTETVVLAVTSYDSFLSPFEDLIVADGGVHFAEGSIPDGPGAIAFVQGVVTVGTPVADVIGRVANAIVYYDDDTIFGVFPSGSPLDPGTGASLSELFGRAVAAESDPDGEFALRVAPNPVSGTGSVSFGLAEGGPVTVALFDALGRRVALLADGPYGPGRHEAALDASALPAGVYVVRVLAGGEARTARVTVVR